MFAVHASIIFGPLLGALYGVLFALIFWNRSLDRAQVSCGDWPMLFSFGSPWFPAPR